MPMRSALPPLTGSSTSKPSNAPPTCVVAVTKLKSSMLLKNTPPEMIPTLSKKRSTRKSRLFDSAGSRYGLPRTISSSSVWV